MVSVVIHTNLALENQRETSSWLAEGFRRHGLYAEVTADKHKKGDIQVVQGPWYAYREWLGKDNVLWLDRGFWGDSRHDLSIGWLNPDGSRDFCNAECVSANGNPPELAEKKTEGGAVVLADYGGLREAQHWAIEAREKWFPVFTRAHPADTHRYFETLEEVFSRCVVAIGNTSTALVKAVIAGLQVYSHDPRHVVQSLGIDRQIWLNQLSWAMWNSEQIRRGDFWAHLNKWSI